MVKGKFYVMTSCGMVVEHETIEEAQNSMDNSLGGGYGFSDDKLLDHYPSEQEWDAYMAEAKAVETAYTESCKAQREAREPRQAPDEINQVELPDERRLVAAEVACNDYEVYGDDPL